MRWLRRDYSMESLEQSASAFQKEFGNPNIQAVGVGKDDIHVYLIKKVGLKKYPKEYHGYAVKLHVVGKIQIGE